MIFDYQFGNISIHEDSTVEVAFDFTNDLGTGDSVNGDTTTAQTDQGKDATSTLILSTTNDTIKVYVTLSGGVGGESYEVKIIAGTTLGRSLTRFITVDVTGDFELIPALGAENQNSYVSLQEANEYVKSNFYHPDQWDNLSFEGRRRLLTQAAKDIDILNYKGKLYYKTQPLAFPRNHNETFSGTASPVSASSLRGNNLYSSTYNKIPNNYFKGGTVHITRGAHRAEVKYIDSSTASPSGGFGQINTASTFTSIVVASDTYLIFTPLDQLIKDAQCEQAMWLIENRMSGYYEYIQAGIGYVRTGDLGMSFKDQSKSFPDIVPAKVRKLLGRHTRKVLKYGRA